MPADLIHLVRHGEVFNPDGVLYGRIPGFHLSELGHRMAEAASVSLAGHPVTALYASPLQRTQESARPWADQFGLPIVTDERIIEPHNRFEGERFAFSAKILAKPRYWPMVVNPMRPSWGEPFVEVAARMLAAIDDAWHASDGGEVVMVSHQMPIWMVARAVAGNKLYHDPRKRRCNLSSITTLARRGEGATLSSKGVPLPPFVEVNYQDPAKDLLARSTDLGAV